jgi:hypothetical protein
MRGWLFGVVALCAVVWAASPAAAQEAPADPASAASGVVELHFTPVDYAQLAIWIERQTGDFLATVRLTEAVALRGIGNRPGASQMNSGFRWPYGRREGALPIWATRRASAPDAKLFRSVIFQDRTTEGLASRTSNDYSKDDYYCLSFDRSRSSKDALDAVSCASVFNSDKGRFLTQADVDGGYSEPYEMPGTHDGIMRKLPLGSLYPARRDIAACGDGCFQHADVMQFNADAHAVMPDIDAVTMATPVGGVEQNILFTVPPEWEFGDYRACIEINVEGDYNATWNDTTMPTPMSPGDCTKNGKAALCWDSWALGYGYPYRGQPSVVYCADFHIGDDAERSFTTDMPAGSSGNWSYEAPDYGTLQSMDGMTDDPVHAPGSGADRLSLSEDGYRMKVVVKPSIMCDEDKPPSAVRDLEIDRYPGKLHAHQWARVRFGAASDDRGVFRYEVRVATAPITDDVSFMAATPAKQATLEAAELLVPTTAKPGQMIQVDMGGLVQATHYYVAVRAMDACTGVGPIRSAEFITPMRQFATVSPCFVATAAYGSPMAKDVSVLRRLRDRYLLTNDLGRALVSAYYAVGPALADVIRGRETLRAAARVALAPIVELARRLD